LAEIESLAPEVAFASVVEFPTFGRLVDDFWMCAGSTMPQEAGVFGDGVVLVEFFDHFEFYGPVFARIFWLIECTAIFPKIYIILGLFEEWARMEMG